MAKPKRPPRPKAETPPPAERSELRFALIVLLIHAAITLFVALKHEPWRDEADVWLLLRDGGVGTMLARTGYVGMPALWYLMVAPLTILKLPYVSMTLLHLVVAWAALLVFLLHAPFPRWIKVFFAFSYFVAYEYSVVARPYAVMLLCLFAALAYWRRREENPLPSAVFVALMANSTTHGLFMAAFLGAIYLGEVFFKKRLKDRRALLALAIMLLGGLLSAWQLLPPEDAPQTHIFRGKQWGSVPWAVGNAFYPGLSEELWVPFTLGLISIIVISMGLGRRIGAQVFYWASLLSLLTIYVLVWIAGYRHAGLLLISVIAAMWLASIDDGPPGAWAKAARIALGVSLIYCTAVAVRYWYWDATGVFSGSKEMAEFLRRNHLDRYEIAAHLPTTAESLLPYLPDEKRFYYAGMHKHGSYMTWDRDYNLATTLPFSLAVAAAEQELAGKPWLLLVNERMGNPERAGFRLVHTNLRPPFEKKDERYWLYAPLDWPGPPLTELR